MSGVAVPDAGEASNTTGRKTSQRWRQSSSTRGEVLRCRAQLEMRVAKKIYAHPSLLNDPHTHTTRPTEFAPRIGIRLLSLAVRHSKEHRGCDGAPCHLNARIKSVASVAKHAKEKKRSDSYGVAAIG